MSEILKKLGEVLEDRKTKVLANPMFQVYMTKVSEKYVIKSTKSRKS